VLEYGLLLLSDRQVCVITSRKARCVPVSSDVAGFDEMSIVSTSYEIQVHYSASPPPAATLPMNNEGRSVHKLYEIRTSPHGRRVPTVRRCAGGANDRLRSTDLFGYLVR
jgi:hypothetical protein